MTTGVALIRRDSYYHLTRDGELALASFKKQWRVFRDADDEILSEGSQE